MVHAGSIHRVWSNDDQVSHLPRNLCTTKILSSSNIGNNVSELVRRSIELANVAALPDQSALEPL